MVREKNTEPVSGSLAHAEEENIPVIREIRTKKAKVKFKFSMMAKVMALFVLGMLVLFRFAKITEIGYKTNDIIAQRDALAEDNNKLEVRIEKEINLSEIREIAETRLKLKAPNESQIIYINTDTSNRVDYSDDVEEEDEGIINNILRWIKGFLGIIE